MMQDKARSLLLSVLTYYKLIRWGVATGAVLGGPPRSGLEFVRSLASVGACGVCSLP